MKRLGLPILAVLALVACDGGPKEKAAQKGPPITAQAPVPPPGTGPDARTPFGPTKRAIDPKSSEAAEQIVEHFGALIEQGQWSEAETLWSNVRAAEQFTLDLKDNAETHLKIEGPSESEGAAGSIYLSVPVSFYGKRENGEQFASPALVTLRRVNDVPGSIEAQRHWHIERIERRTR